MASQSTSMAHLAGAPQLQLQMSSSAAYRCCSQSRGHLGNAQCCNILLVPCQGLPCMPAALLSWPMRKEGLSICSIYNGSLFVCRHQDELFFVSERDGNMELYSRRVKNEVSSRHSYQRMTSDPSLQVRTTLSVGAALSFTLG